MLPTLGLPWCTPAGPIRLPNFDNQDYVRAPVRANRRSDSQEPRSSMPEVLYFGRRPTKRKKEFHMAEKDNIQFAEQAIAAIMRGTLIATCNG